MRLLQRTILLILLLSGLCCVALPAFAATDTLQVNVDNKTTQFQAKTVGNLVFLSAHDIAELFSANLSYDATKKELTFKSSNTTAILSIGSSNMTLNQKKVSLDASPMLINNTSYIPVKAINIIWGASYANNEQTLYIQKNGGTIQIPETEKVLSKRQALSIGGKSTPVSYVLIPKSSNLSASVVLAQNTIGQTESLSSLAKRTSAKAAINGSYFQSYDNTKSQESYGILIKNGNLIQAEGTGSTIGFTKNGTIKMDIVRSVITANIGGNNYNISLLNHTPATNSNTIVMYTSAYGKNTGCAFGTSVTVQNGEIVSIQNKKAVAIPNNGYVLIFTGNESSVASTLAKGMKVSYHISYTNQAGTKLDWSDVKTAISAGPLLLKDGKSIINPAKEGFTESAGFDLAVARSAVGINKNGDILLVAGVKCTLNQLADVMKQLGATQAICMDCGSSSGLYVPGHTLPAPSKEISNALIFK